MNKTVVDILNMKGKERIAVLTAYDFPTATFLDEAGVDILLVGDSVANVVYGHPNTLSITMDDMIRHVAAVSRATKNALVVADLPFGSYQPSTEMAVKSATRFLAEGGAHAVKLEGGLAMADTVKRLVEIGIPVMGHVGLTPQSVNQLGGYRMQGKTPSELERIQADAKSLEEAGAFSVVLECVDREAAGQMTSSLRIPTIGIGSGDACDGQVLVSHDLFGFTAGHVPKFVQPIVNLRTILTEAATSYVSRVKGVKHARH